MKNFIQNKLKLILEGVYASKNQLANFRHKMVAAKKGFPEDYFKNVGEGDGTYVIQFDRHGYSSAPSKRGHASNIKKRMGDRGGNPEHKITFNIKAYRGVEHTGTYKERTGDAKTIDGRRVRDGEVGDPFSDVAIKALIIYGDQILKFMQEVSYMDGSGAEIAAAANSPKQIAKAKEKKDKEIAAASKPKKQAPDVTALQKRIAVLNTKMESLRGNAKPVRNEANKVRKELKRLNRELKDLEYAGSSKDDYLKSKNK